MSDTPQVLLAHHLKALKLPTFLRDYDKVARQCAAEGVDAERFLLRLAELELIDRERRLVERRIRAARFPAVCRRTRYGARKRTRTFAHPPLRCSAPISVGEVGDGAPAATGGSDDDRGPTRAGAE